MTFRMAAGPFAPGDAADRIALEPHTGLLLVRPPGVSERSVVEVRVAFRLGAPIPSEARPVHPGHLDAPGDALACSAPCAPAEGAFTCTSMRSVREDQTKVIRRLEYYGCTFTRAYGVDGSARGAVRGDVGTVTYDFDKAIACIATRSSIRAYRLLLAPEVYDLTRADFCGDFWEYYMRGEFDAAGRAVRWEGWDVHAISFTLARIRSGPNANTFFDRAILSVEGAVEFYRGAVAVARAQFSVSPGEAISERELTAAEVGEGEVAMRGRGERVGRSPLVPGFLWAAQGPTVLSGRCFYNCVLEVDVGRFRAGELFARIGFSIERGEYYFFGAKTVSTYALCFKYNP